MTQEDLHSMLLLVGFNGEFKPANPYTNYKLPPLTRLVGTGDYDVAVEFFGDGGVYVHHDLDDANASRWHDSTRYDNAGQAWDFIRQFLQDHPV